MPRARTTKPAPRICVGCDAELAPDKHPSAKFCSEVCKHRWHCRQTKRRRREEAKAAKEAAEAKKADAAAKRAARRKAAAR